ncbi:penicillin acylase family protein [Cyclobacterium amurskyense]|uniref:penicillin acylase family protein n=1 Tax=Cyclobacterium amurskyense TaxID=320787 RepID=UPI000A5A284C|nr:penicillin acylase family protein [Cyclobacterium amurskyense]
MDDKWVATKINWDPVNALIQSFTRTKLSDYTAFREMMDIRTNSSNNTVFADASGNIAYFHGNFIPKRDPSFDFSRPVDGSDPATDWQGLHEVEESIVVLNPRSGWIQNCNSTPFTSAGPFSPKKEDYPYYMAPDAENYRGIHAVGLLSEVKDLTLEKLITLGYDPYLPAFERLIPILLKAYEEEENPSDNLTAAIAVFRDWDYQTGEESVAMTLAHFFGMSFNRNIGNSDALIPFNQENGKTLKYDTSEVIAAMEAAIVQLEEDFGTWNIPWGDVNRFQRLSGAIDLPFDDNKASLPIGLASGRWGALASFGATAKENTKKLYGSSGNSFVAAVEFGDKVRAKSLLAGGQNANPKSLHFDDQAEMYANGTFKEVAYYREDVEKRAEETYHPGSR